MSSTPAERATVGIADGDQRQMKLIWIRTGHQRYTEYIPKATTGPRRPINFREEEPMHARLNETMSFVEERRRQLLAAVDGVSDDRLSQRTGPDGWSVAEILEHLRMVEAGIARLISKRVGQGRDAGLREKTQTPSVIPSSNNQQKMRKSAFLHSPPAVRPRPDIDVTEALQGLASSRD